MTNIGMTITKVLVLTGQGPDRVTLFTVFPGSFSIYENEPLTLSFEAEAGTGCSYVRDNFGIGTIEVIVRGGNRKSSR